jgi:altronate dehydratase
VTEKGCARSIDPTAFLGSGREAILGLNQTRLPKLGGYDRNKLRRQFLATLLAIASGARTAAEKQGQRTIAIWKRGVTL